MEKLIRKYKQTPSYVNLFCKICNIEEEKKDRKVENTWLIFGNFPPPPKVRKQTVHSSIESQAIL